jgi:formylglycine-generating enzyme required for sulfatase activity
MLLKRNRQFGFLVVLTSSAAIIAFSSAARSDDNKPSEKNTSNDKTTGLLKTFVDEFVAITPGEGKFPASFQMGSAEGPPNERPQHKVTFNYRFGIAKYEVPQNLYEAVMGNNPSKWKGPRNSVEMMTWTDANEFCKKVTELLRDKALIDETEHIRLPTEAEWEYCCRAGTTTKYSFGDEAQNPDDIENKATRLDVYGWHTGNAAGNDPPVGALKPNPWGLYDMHGYLWEFTADQWFDDYQTTPKDGSPAQLIPVFLEDPSVERIVEGSLRQADQHGASQNLDQGRG